MTEEKKRQTRTSKPRAHCVAKRRTLRVDGEVMEAFTLEGRGFEDCAKAEASINRGDYGPGDFFAVTVREGFRVGVKQVPKVESTPLPVDSPGDPSEPA